MTNAWAFAPPIGPPRQPQRGSRVCFHQQPRLLPSCVLPIVNIDRLSRIARNAGLQVIRSGGVVRGFTNWGAFRLPKVTTKHQARYSEGHHFIMRFDASGPVQSSIRRTLGLDPRMINFSVVKLGDKLEEIKDVEGKVEWNKTRSIADSI